MDLTNHWDQSVLRFLMVAAYCPGKGISKRGQHEAAHLVPEHWYPPELRFGQPSLNDGEGFQTTISYLDVLACFDETIVEPGRVKLVYDDYPPDCCLVLTDDNMEVKTFLGLPAADRMDFQDYLQGYWKVVRDALTAGITLTKIAKETNHNSVLGLLAVPRTPKDFWMDIFRDTLRLSELGYNEALESLPDLGDGESFANETNVTVDLGHAMIQLRFSEAKMD